MSPTKEPIEQLIQPSVSSSGPPIILTPEGKLLEYYFKKSKPSPVPKLPSTNKIRVNFTSKGAHPPPSTSEGGTPERKHNMRTRSLGKPHHPLNLD